MISRIFAGMKAEGWVVAVANFDYNEEQKKAVFNLDDDIILGAGAGSGKTRVLVGRYLHLLEERRAGIEDILAITFTNKAADEMVERIRDEITDRSQQGELEVRRFWYEELLKLNQARITTFHSFAGRVLRENPVAADIDPDFKIMDEEERDRILTEVVDEVIEAGLAAADEPLLTLAGEYSLYNLPGLLVKLFHSLQKTALSTGEVIKRSEKYLEELRSQREEFKNRIIELGEELIAVYEEEGATGRTVEKMEAFKREWPRIKEAVSSLERVDDREKLQLVQRIPEIIKNKLSKSVNDTARELKDLIRDDKEFASYLILDRLEEIIGSVGEVVGRIEDEYQRFKSEEQVLDFTDLELTFVRLLEENEELLKGLHQRFSYIMVDEFQDNSPRQEKLISLLGEGKGVNLFLVGDPKQSIYRFRGADVTVFNRQKKKIRDRSGRELELMMNFRSQQPILEFVNFVFSRLMGDGSIEYQSLKAYRQTGRDNLELLMIDRKEFEPDDYRLEEGFALAERIRKLVLEQEIEIEEDGSIRPVSYGDIALLFQSLTSVEKYEQALQASGIPYVVVNGRGFYEQQEIVDILNLLKVIDNHNRVIPLAGLLRSPFCGIDDEALYYLSRQGGPWQQIADIDTDSPLDREKRECIIEFRQLILAGRQWKDSLSPHELVRRLLEMSNYYDGLAGGPYYQQQRANIEKLLNIIEDFYRRELPSLRGTIDYIEEKREKYNREGLAPVEQEEGNLVQLMSIHQAKGLEFPVVILPDCQRKIFSHQYIPDVLLDEERGLGIKVNLPYKKRKNIPSPLYNELSAREREEEIAESQRLFYVAITRARDYLIISGSPAGELKYDDLNRAGCWLDWLACSSGVDLLTRAREGSEVIGFDNEDFTGRLKLKLINESQDKDISVEKLNSGIKEDEDAEMESSLPEIADWNDRDEWLEHAPMAAAVPIIESMQVPVLSPTGFMIYRDCPRQYYLKYHRGLPEYYSSARELFTGSRGRSLSPGDRGTLIHRLCELSPDGSNMDRLYDEVGQEMGLTGEDSRLKEEILAVVRSYLKRNEACESDQDNVIREKREQEFTLKLDGFQLRGAIDRFLILADNSAEIVDLKTNNIESTEVEEKADYYLLQLESYALAAYKIWDLSPVRARVDFLVPGESREYNFQKADLLRLEKKFNALGREIISGKEEGDFPPIDKECGYCNYGYICNP